MVPFLATATKPLHVCSREGLTPFDNVREYRIQGLDLSHHGPMARVMGDLTHCLDTPTSSLEGIVRRQSRLTFAGRGGWEDREADRLSLNSR